MAVTQIIKTLGNVLEGMKTIIDSWLSTNITNPSSPPLDRSLSLANAAAPADLVGDLKTKIDTIDDKAPVIVESVSGDIVSFDDGAEDMPLKKCLIQIKPIQDLHGQDNPYPAGGGKNKYSGPSTVSVNNQLFANIAVDPIPAGIYTISAIIGSAPVIGTGCRISFRDISGTGFGTVILPFTANTRTSISFTLSQTCYQIYFYYDIPTSGSGNQTFTDVQIEPGTAMTDYAPYANICPITGWTGVTAYRTGKNLLPLKVYNGASYNAAVGTQFTLSENTGATKDDTSISADVSGWQGVAMLSNPLKPGSYHLYAITTSTNMRMTRYVLDKDFKVTRNVGNTGSGTSATIDRDVTIGTDECYILVYLASSATGSVKFEYPQIELGSSASSYEEYSGTTIPVVFPDEAGTVYGGTLDLTTGVLTVDRLNVDLGSLSWSSWNDGTGLIFNAELPGKTQQRVNADCISSMYKYRSVVSVWSNLLNGEMTGNAQNQRIYIRNTAYNDNDTFKAEMSGVQIVYTLATPLTYQLTPEEIKTLFQNNSIWSDISPVSVDYCADTKTYIDNKIAEIVNG